MGDVKNKLKQLRKKFNLSREALAVKAGVSYPYIVGLEMGIRDNPSLSVLEKLANALEVSLDELVGREFPRSSRKKPS